MLKHYEVHFLAAGKKVPSRRFKLAGESLRGAFGTYGILRKIADSKPQDYYKTLWSRSGDVPMWIGTRGYDDSLDDVLQMFSVTKFGGARIAQGTKEALLTLADFVGLMGAGRLSTSMSTDDVCSVAIAIASDRPIIEAAKEMITRSVRRLFVRGEQGDFVSDRSLVDYMFSPGRLEIARDSPEKWIDGNVSDLATRTPGRCNTGPLGEAAKAMGPAPDDCLLTDELRLVTRWDLVVKPWKSGKLEAVGN